MVTAITELFKDQFQSVQQEQVRRIQRVADPPGELQVFFEADQEKGQGKQRVGLQPQEGGQRFGQHGNG